MKNIIIGADYVAWLSNEDQTLGLYNAIDGEAVTGATASASLKDGDTTIATEDAVDTGSDGVYYVIFEAADTANLTANKVYTIHWTATKNARTFKDTVDVRACHRAED